MLWDLRHGLRSRGVALEPLHMVHAVTASAVWPGSVTDGISLVSNGRSGTSTRRPAMTTAVFVLPHAKVPAGTTCEPEVRLLIPVCSSDWSAKLRLIVVARFEIILWNFPGHAQKIFCGYAFCMGSTQN